MPLDKKRKPLFLSGCVMGLNGDKPVAIHLNPELGTDEYPLTYGYELSHIFIETAAGIPVKRH